jgi:hypothetical protein
MKIALRPGTKTYLGLGFYLIAQAGAEIQSHGLEARAAGV